MLCYLPLRSDSWSLQSNGANTSYNGRPPLEIGQRRVMPLVELWRIRLGLQYRTDTPAVTVTTSISILDWVHYQYGILLFGLTFCWWSLTQKNSCQTKNRWVCQISTLFIPSKQCSWPSYCVPKRKTAVVQLKFLVKQTWSVVKQTMWVISRNCLTVSRTCSTISRTCSPVSRTCSTVSRTCLTVSRTCSTVCQTSVRRLPNFVRRLSNFVRRLPNFVRRLPNMVWVGLPNLVWGQFDIVSSFRRLVKWNGGSSIY